MMKRVWWITRLPNKLRLRWSREVKCLHMDMLITQLATRTATIMTTMQVNQCCQDPALNIANLLLLLYVLLLLLSSQQHITKTMLLCNTCTTQEHADDIMSDKHARCCTKATAASMVNYKPVLITLKQF